MNNKGFTLVELIAVLAVMLTILLIAIPSISSTIDRNKENLSSKSIDIIKAANEIYVSTYLKKDIKTSYNNGTCYVKITDLINKDILSLDEIKESSKDNEIDKIIIYKENNSIVVSKSTTIQNHCIN